MKFFLAVTLLLVMLFPSGIQFAHIFDGHEHVVCSEQTTHIHEDTLTCELCNLCPESFNYTFLKYSEILLTETIVSSGVSLYRSVYHSYELDTSQLRGPPGIS